MSLQDFDARSVQPQQGIGAHPPGMFDFIISHTYLKETKDGQGLMLVVEFTTPAGKIDNRYNIYNKSQQAMDIAQKELSALCHAVSVYNLRYPKNPDGSPIYDRAAMELRNARGRIEVAPQMKDGQPTQFMEIKTIFDTQGNAPGKGGSAQPAQQQPQNPAPMQQQPNGGGWATPQPQAPQQQPQPQQQPNPQQWGAPQGQPQQQQPAQPGGGWQPQQNAAPGPAPWNKP